MKKFGVLLILCFIIIPLAHSAEKDGPVSSRPQFSIPGPPDDWEVSLGGVPKLPSLRLNKKSEALLAIESAKVCEETLTRQPAEATEPLNLTPHEAVAELILLLSYNHPLVHHIANRAKSVDQLDAFLNLLWGFQYPLYVAENLHVEDARILFENSVRGQIIFPLHTIKTQTLSYLKSNFSGITDGFIDEQLSKDLSGYFTSRLKAYHYASSWDNWNKADDEFRYKEAKNFINSLWYQFQLIIEKVEPTIDPRTARQKVNYQFKQKPLIYHETRAMLPNKFDIILPAEFARLKTLIDFVGQELNGPVHQLAVEYIAQYLPLLLEARRESIGLQIKSLSQLPVAQSTVRSRWSPMRLLAAVQPSTWRDNKSWSSARNNLLVGNNPEDTPFPTYLNQNLTLEQIKQFLYENVGPKKVRLQQHAQHLTTIKTAVAPPEELQQVDATESSFVYDINSLIAGQPVKLELPAGQIEKKISEIPNPSTETLTTLSGVRKYGSEISFYLNLLSQNLSVLKSDGYKLVAQHIKTAQQKILDDGVRLDAKTLHQLGLALSSFEQREQIIQQHTEEIEKELTSFISKTEDYLSPLGSLIENATDQNIQLALLQKKEELQTILIIAKSQMLNTLELKKKNQHLLYASLRHVQILLISLSTKSVVSGLTEEDLTQLSEALGSMCSALQPAETQSP